MNLNVTIVSIGAGFAYGTAGYSHHLVEDISILSVLPNLRIFSPCDPSETEYVMEKILLTSDPKYLRLGKGNETNLDLMKSQFSLDKNTNYDIVFLFTGSIGTNILKAVEKLKDFNTVCISINEISHENVAKYLLLIGQSKIVTVEEHVLRGGFGSIVLETLNTLGLGNEILRLGITHLDHIGQGNEEYLRAQYYLTPDGIISAVQNFLSRSN